ncbi:hypothetical protein [Novosphingobium sp.]|uniref:hypothetical protein n=1 Tax=Novosphingobium sp. TaxID=1874826 RepID=UPI0025FFF29A|nr:hypothetical protein [Novosphingobium sp.]
MATDNPAAPRRPRRRRQIVWLAMLALAAALAWFWQPLNGYARVGTAYGARVACSCRFEGGRSLGDCRKDFEDGMQLIMLSENSAAKSVTARFPLLASDTATYREGEGCRLKPWTR